jgi:hypothetical protein
MEDGQRLFVWRAAFDRRGEQAPRPIDVAVVERLQALMHEGFRLALPFGLSAAGAVDIGAGAVVGAVEEQDAGPDVHRVVHASGEVLVESRDEQLFDAPLAFGVGQRISERRITGRRVDHACKSP